ncbi:MAG: hypothetical protein LV481_14615 [Methylacidiphilales bacterium]|nr:hypothetical protein [Candidatus Methylacidiphilales bacterium]
MNGKKRIFDSKGFISPPFLACPKCKKTDCFGVLLISGNGYTRRCRECWFSMSFKLPDLQKRVIYLDQFAISEMMKAVNDKLGKKHKIDTFYFTLFEKLELLTKAQLIVCPDSAFHRNESALYHYQSHKKMYEHLSHGITFYDPATIRRFQIEQRFQPYITREKYVFVGKPTSVLHGSINEWNDRFRISLNSAISDEEIDGICNSRQKAHQAISEVFERWKTEKTKTLNDWFTEEGLAYGRMVVKNYLDSIARLLSCRIGNLNLGVGEMMSITMGEENVLFASLGNYIHADNPGEELTQIASFLTSREMLEIPFVRISALLWAHLAHAAAHGGQKTPPNAGMVSDIDMISTLLPYSSAIFVDKQMFGILNTGTFTQEIKKYGTKVFSRTNEADFLSYLDEIKAQMGDNHLEKLNEVYGQNWATPYWEMYEK